MTGIIFEKHVENKHGCHGLDDGHGPGNDARVVPASVGEGEFAAMDVDSMLGTADGGGRLEGDTKVKVIAGSDPAQKAASMVGKGTRMSIVSTQRVIVLAPPHGCCMEPLAILESLGGVNAHHVVGKAGLESVENGFSKAGR